MPGVVLDSTPGTAASTSELRKPQSIPAFGGYTPQPFPNLCDQTRVKPSRVNVECKVSPLAEGWTTTKAISIARAAWVRLGLAYADVDDLLLNELGWDAGTSAAPTRVRFVRVKNVSESQNSAIIEKIAQDAADAPICDPREVDLSGLISFVANQESPAEWFPRSGVALEANCSGERNSPLDLRIVADGSHCSQGAAELLLSQISALINSIVANPFRPFLINGKASISFPPDLNDSALHSIYKAQHDPQEAKLPIQWLYQQGRRRPNAVAHELYATGSSPKEILTYGDLDRRSNQMARWLQKNAAVKRGSRVGVCRERDGAFYICMAGILKAGGCYVPIDIDQPTERKRYIASDSGAALVLCRSGGENIFETPAQQVDSNEFWHNVASLPSEPLDADEASLDSLAYVQYTSGTTGTPKGCKLTHRGLFWAIRTMVEMPSQVTNPDTDKRLAMAAVAFDVHVSEIVQSWALGTSLVSVRSRLELISNLQQYIEDFGITHIGMVPSMIESCLFKGPEELPLKYMVSGGDKLSDEVLSKWAAHPKLLFAQFYGPSECHIGCLARRMRGVMDRKDNIGLPFPGSAAYVVDAEMNIVPKGVPGELVIEGDLVGTGYLNLEEATKKNFVAFPLPDSRAYRTGDLVRMNHDGTILISGRVDSQIKLRGVRIESEGVSNVIRKASKKQPLEAVTAIATHPETGSAEILVTFVASQGVYTAVQRRDPPSLTELPDDLSTVLREAAETELASYMRPGHIVPVKFLPLSHNGKVDVKLLVQMFKDSSMQSLQEAQGLASATDSSEGEEDLDCGMTASETVVSGMIASLLGVPESKLRPGRRLFELGLSSLQFARLTALVNKQFDTNLSVAGVMAAATIRGAAQIAEKGTNAKHQAPAGDLDLAKFQVDNFDAAAALFKREDIEAVLPPLPVQPGILAQVVQSTSQSYVQHFLYTLSPQQPQTARSLEAAIKELIRENQMLRTAFVVDEADLLQVVFKDASGTFPVRTTPVAATDAEAFKAAFQRDIAAEVVGRINEDVTTPMWEIILFEDAASDRVRYMSVSLSHVIYDAFATAALMRQLDSLVGHASLPVRPDLQSVLREIGKISAAEHRQFWNTFLAPALGNPGHLKQLTSSRATRQSHLMDVPLSDVRLRASQVGVTTEAFFNAVFALSGSRAHLWERFAIFGTVQSGRSLGLEGIESAVMPLVTVFPMAIESQDASKTLGGAQRALLDTAAHSHFPLGQIQASVGQRQLFDVLFSCRQAHASKRYRHFTHLETSATTLEFPLAIEVLFDESADTIEVKAAASEAEFETETVAKLLALLEDTTRDLCGREDLAVVDLAASPSDASQAVEISSTSASEDVKRAPVDPTILSAIVETTAAFLKIDASKITPNTSLVSLGITSLSAVALSMRLQEAGVSVDAISILQGDRPNRIAPLAKSSQNQSAAGDSSASDQPSEVEQQLLAELDSTSLALNDRDVVSVGPATPLQEGMLSQTVANHGQAYVHAFPLILAPSVDIQRLQDAWRAAMDAFDILRTTFHFATETGRWAAVPHNRAAVELPWIELASDKSTDVLSKEAVAALRLHDSAAFASRPAWQLTLVTGRQNPDQRILVVAAHHALYDGASMHSLLSHVRRAYGGLAIPSPAQGSFQDFARQVSRHVDTSVAFWIKQLKTSPDLGTQQMPSGRSRDGGDRNRAWRASSSLGGQFADDFSRLCRRYRITSQSVAQLALARAVSLWSGRRDVTFCQVVGGRTAKGTGELVGPCFNTIPCRIALEDRLSVREALKSVHAGNMQALPHQHAALRAIQKGCGVASLSDVLFVFQPNLGQDDGDAAAADAAVWQPVARSSEVNETTTHFSLNLEVWEKPHGLDIKSSASIDCMADVQELQDFIALYAECLKTLTYAPADKLLPTTWTPRFPVQSRKAQESNGDSVDISDDELVADKNVQAVRGALCRATRLDASKVKLSASLASLGLDSIAAIQVASHARQAGVQLSPADIVRSPTVRALFATVVKGARVNGQSDNVKRLPAQLPSSLLQQVESKLVPSLRGKVSAWRPTPGMETVFSGWQTSGGRFAQMVLIRRVTKHMDTMRLQQAWNALSDKHETLRSTMVPLSHEGQDRCALAIVDSPADWDPHFQVHQYEGDGDDVAVATAKHFLLSPPPISSPPNTMVALTGSKGEVTHVVLYLPHFQYDGWSLGPLMRDLEALYAGTEAGAGSDLRGLLGLCSNCDSDAGLEAEYWRKALDGVDLDAAMLRPTTTTAGPETAATSPVTCYESRHSPDMPLMSDLDAVAMARDVTLSSIVFATWAMVQRRRSGDTTSSSTCFSVVQHGRSLPLDGIENLAAITMNLLPLPVHFEGDARSRDAVFTLARQIQDTLNARPAEADQCRWRELSRWLGRSESQPLTNVVLNVQHFVQKGKDTAADVSGQDSGSGQTSARIWEPLVVPLRLTEEEQLRESLSWEHLGRPSPSTLSFREMAHSILRIGVRSDSGSGRLVLHAEYVLGALARNDVDGMLGEWEGLLRGLLV